jgi:hypothetical protein
MSGRGPLWAQRVRWITRGGANGRLRDVRGASAAIQRSILVAIADVCDDAGDVHEECELTAASLGAECLCHEDTARRALKALREAELITAEPRTGRSTRYALVVTHIDRVDATPHRWRGQAPALGSRAQPSPSHDATPCTMRPTQPPASCGVDPSHGAGPPPAPCGPTPSHSATPHPSRIGEGSQDREDRSGGGDEFLPSRATRFSSPKARTCGAVGPSLTVVEVARSSIGGRTVAPGCPLRSATRKPWAAPVGAPELGRRGRRRRARGPPPGSRARGASEGDFADVADEDRGDVPAAIGDARALGFRRGTQRPGRSGAMGEKMRRAMSHRRSEESCGRCRAGP